SSRSLFAPVVVCAAIVAAPRPPALADESVRWSESHVYGLGLVYALSYSPDGQKLAVAGIAGVQVWDVPSWTQQYDLTGHADWVRAVAWSPDGARLASGSRDQTIKIWDSASGALLSTLQGHADTVNALAWSPDGSLLASGSDDRDIRLWTA